MSSSVFSSDAPALDCTLFKTHYFAGITSDKYGRRMFRSVGAGSNIPDGLSSRRAVPTSAESNNTLADVLMIEDDTKDPDVTKDYIDKMNFNIKEATTTSFGTAFNSSIAFNFYF